ncbi:MAG: hypothetical protein AAFX50_12935 [Acidobacteriota bacterium]
MSSKAHMGILRATLAGLQDRGANGAELVTDVTEVCVDLVAASTSDDEARRILATPEARRMAASPDPVAAIIEGVSQLLCVAGACKRCPDALRRPKAEEPGLGTAVVG